MPLFSVSSSVQFGGQKVDNWAAKMGCRGGGSWEAIRPCSNLSGCLVLALNFWARLFALYLGVFHW